jgi:UDP-N-acetylmuramoyl-L-alanyl-D-glutamate--2,6-diaminopimelate ligase
MGTALNLYSDVSIYTSDNPRSEDPMEILAEMTDGIEIANLSRVIVDRADAISYAVSLAQKGDLVVILGKGHELGQEIKGEVFPFDDREILAVSIEARK